MWRRVGIRRQLVRLIATSRTFRQSSAAPEGMWKSDPQNRLLARGPRYRLTVQGVRDQALAVSGRLDPEVGGPPVLVDEPTGTNRKPLKLPYEKSDSRRTIYAFWKRNSPPPVLAAFDVADRNQCDIRAYRTNTPLQALVTLNAPGFAESAKAFGQRAREAGETDVDRLGWAWLACTGREAGTQGAGPAGKVA